MVGEPIDRARQIRFWLLALLGFLLVLYLLRAMLLPFVAGMAVAYFLDPVCDRLQRLGCSLEVVGSILRDLEHAAIIALEDGRLRVLRELPAHW